MDKLMNYKNSNVKGAIWISIACFFAYTACNISKNILSAMMPQMIDNRLFSEISLGKMGSCLLLSYGIGQLINGFIGNRVSPKYMVFTGLFVPAIIIFVFPFCSLELIAVIMWGVCGFFCSMLWGPISRTIAENTDKKVGRVILTIMTIASVFGMLATYLVAIITSKMQNFRVGFFASSGIIIVISVTWLISYVYMEKQGFVKKISKERTFRKNNGSIKDILNTEFILMIAITMINGVVRNAVSFWIPTFISQNFDYSTGLSSAISIALPIVNVLGTFVSLYALKYTKNNEKIMCTYLFGVTVAMFFIVFLCGEGFSVIAIPALFIASAAMMGVCNMIFSIYILRFATTGLISGVTGFLDFSSYMSASVFNTIFTGILSVGSWNTVVILWIAITVVGLMLSFWSMKYDR